MEKTISGVFPSAADAEDAVKMLRAEGIPPDEITIYTLDSDEDKTPDIGRKGGSTGSIIDEGDKISATAAGAVTGGLLGAMIGILAGIGAIALPGFSILLTAGPTAAAIAGIAIGSATGGLVGALVDAAVPHEHPEAYLDHMSHGDVMVSVRVEHHLLPRTRSIFEYYNAHEIRT